MSHLNNSTPNRMSWYHISAGKAASCMFDERMPLSCVTTALHLTRCTVCMKLVFLTCHHITLDCLSMPNISCPLHPGLLECPALVRTPPSQLVHLPCSRFLCLPIWLTGGATCTDRPGVLWADGGSGWRRKWGLSWSLVVCPARYPAGL